MNALTQAASTAIAETTDMPDLTHAQAASVGLGCEYYSPQVAGEMIRGYVVGIQDMPVCDTRKKESDPDRIRPLKSVLLAVPDDHRNVLKLYNASVILVSTIEQAIMDGTIVPGTLDTPVQITYRGLKETKTGNKVAQWHVCQLRPAIEHETA